jgi:hypothetical protein
VTILQSSDAKARRDIAGARRRIAAKMISQSAYFCPLPLSRFLAQIDP